MPDPCPCPPVRYGLNPGRNLEQIPKVAKPSQRKGRQSQKNILVRGVIREVRPPKWVAAELGGGMSRRGLLGSALSRGASATAADRAARPLSRCSLSSLLLRVLHRAAAAAAAALARLPSPASPRPPPSSLAPSPSALRCRRRFDPSPPPRRRCCLCSGFRSLAPGRRLLPLREARHGAPAQQQGQEGAQAHEEARAYPCMPAVVAVRRLYGRLTPSCPSPPSLRSSVRSSAPRTSSRSSPTSSRSRAAPATKRRRLGPLRSHAPHLRSLGRRRRRRRREANWGSVAHGGLPAETARAYGRRGFGRAVDGCGQGRREREACLQQGVARESFVRRAS